MWKQPNSSFDEIGHYWIDRYQNFNKPFFCRYVPFDSWPTEEGDGEKTRIIIARLHSDSKSPWGVSCFRRIKCRSISPVLLWESSSGKTVYWGTPSIWTLFKQMYFFFSNYIYIYILIMVMKLVITTYYRHHIFLDGWNKNLKVWYGFQSCIDLLQQNQLVICQPSAAFVNNLLSVDSVIDVLNALTLTCVKIVSLLGKEENTKIIKWLIRCKNTAQR